MKKEDLNAPVSNPEHLHNTEAIKVTPEISDAEPKFVEVSKRVHQRKEAADNVKEVAGNVKEAAGKFAAKNVAEMKKLLPTNFTQST